MVALMRVNEVVIMRGNSCRGRRPCAAGSTTCAGRFIFASRSRVNAGLRGFAGAGDVDDAPFAGDGAASGGVEAAVFVFDVVPTVQDGQADARADDFHVLRLGEGGGGGGALRGAQGVEGGQLGLDFGGGGEGDGFVGGPLSGGAAGLALNDVGGPLDHVGGAGHGGHAVLVQAEAVEAAVLALEGGAGDAVVEGLNEVGGDLPGAVHRGLGEGGGSAAEGLGVLALADFLVEQGEARDVFEALGFDERPVRDGGGALFAFQLAQSGEGGGVRVGEHSERHKFLQGLCCG